MMIRNICKQQELLFVWNFKTYLSYFDKTGRKKGVKVDKSLQQAKEKLDVFFEENHTKDGKPYEISKGYLQWVVGEQPILWA